GVQPILNGRYRGRVARQGEADLDGPARGGGGDTRRDGRRGHRLDGRGGQRGLRGRACRVGGGDAVGVPAAAGVHGERGAVGGHGLGGDRAAPGTAAGRRLVLVHGVGGDRAAVGRRRRPGHGDGEGRARGGRGGGRRRSHRRRLADRDIGDPQGPWPGALAVDRPHGERVRGSVREPGEGVRRRGADGGELLPGGRRADLDLVAGD